jgi:hypothetical protein
MGFKVAQGQPDVKTTWLPVDYQSTLYVGQLVQTFSVSGAINGAAPLAVAAGAGDYGQGQIITGIVIGMNNYPLTELFDSTYGQYIAYAATATAQKAIQKMGQEGKMFPKGDPIPLVQVAILTPSIVVEGPIYNGVYGTALTTLTATGTPTTTAITVNASQIGTQYTLNKSITYCRTGANAGISRVNSDISTTTMTFSTAWPNTPAAGDTFVRVPYTIGDTTMQINPTSTHIGMSCDASIASYSTAGYFAIKVVDMDLSESGKEKLYFSFNAQHFTLGKFNSTSGTTGS